VRLPRCVDENVPLHERTSLRVGGTARWLAHPSGVNEVIEVSHWAGSEHMSWTALGAGTNVLFPDSGYPGVVISTDDLRGVEISGLRLKAAAGEPLSQVARRACEAGLSGLEWAWGIPGSVGGAVAMNAGTSEGEMSGILAEVLSVDSDGVRGRSVQAISFGYRSSPFLTGDLRELVADARFELVHSSPSRTLERAKRLLDERRRRQPTGATAGCTFRNPPEGPPAGQLLDRAGCKGLRIGRAHVSTQHANFILNEGSENAKDVLALIEEMKRRVRSVFGIDLEEEIVLLRRAEQ